ncbi:hypothetical protein [Nguyenibacter vanlangensis]|uniref:Protease prsW family protein n=1 Tax=Nguyenibacter vanlangensis TaxID=1216886 RepID=A0A7Y7ITK2_9PROT|nr:hypothetical protein [Nguyenibacter vanlangensis]NVN10086.1 hypothetical protein [Nguyenibacter vanlangensis]
MNILSDACVLICLCFYPTIWLQRFPIDGKRFFLSATFFISLAIVIICGRTEGYISNIELTGFGIGSLFPYLRIGFTEESIKTIGAICLLGFLKIKPTSPDQVKCFLGIGYFFGLIEGIFRMPGIAANSRKFVLSQSISFDIDIHLALIIQDAAAVYIASSRKGGLKYSVLIMFVTCLEHSIFDYFYVMDPLQIYATILYYIPISVIFMCSIISFYFLGSAKITSPWVPVAGVFFTILPFFAAYENLSDFFCKQNIYIAILFSFLSAISDFYTLLNRKIGIYVHKRHVARQVDVG